MNTCIIHTCVRITDNRCMHHTYMYQGQGSKAKDTCIIHACIKIMYKCTHHASYICASWPRVSGSRIYASYIRVKDRILLLESPCPLVRSLVRNEKTPHHRYTHQGHRSQIYASFIPAPYTHASGSRIIYISIVDTCMMHPCIIHTCIIHHENMQTCILHTCKHASCIHGL